MTKEEARKHLLDWIQYATDPERVPFMDEPCSDEEIILAMRIGADALSQPSLPSVLDEAAEDFAKRHIKLAPFARKFFKAGAEWMAGAGETQEHFVIDSVADSPCGPAVVCYPEKFEIGDKVIVQIRKKQ